MIDDFDSMGEIPREGKEGTGAYRATDPETSKEAYEEKESNIAGLRAEIYEKAKWFGDGGFIMDDMLLWFPERRISTISPRFSELARSGHLWATGEKRKAKVTGVSQQVYAYVPPEHRIEAQMVYAEYEIGKYQVKIDAAVVSLNATVAKLKRLREIFEDQHKDLLGGNNEN